MTLRASITITDHSKAEAAAAMGCPPPKVTYRVEDLLDQEMFGRDVAGDFPSAAPGILPFRPEAMLAAQEQHQELYQYGTQDWLDYWWVRGRFEMFRFVARNEDMVLVEMRDEFLLPGQPQQACYMRLPKSVASEVTEGFK